MYQKRKELDQKLNENLNNPLFQVYYKELIKTNEHTNLTSITEESEVYYKHFYDSLILSKYLDLSRKTILDVGAGAGFPSLPLKIMFDDLKVTIVDSLNKRIRFLSKLSQKLGLDNVELIHSRAEELKRQNRYDIVTARAVAKLNILIELTLPFVKVGGYMIAYKSIHYQEELNAAMNGIELLGGLLERIEEYPISDDEKHVLIFIRKVKKTNLKYPRQFGIIKKQPL